MARQGGLGARGAEPDAAPSRWPRVFLGEREAALPRGMREYAFWEALERAGFNEHGVRLSRRGCCAPWVVERGFLDAAATVCDQASGKRYLLYYYPEPSLGARAHFGV